MKNSRLVSSVLCIAAIVSSLGGVHTIPVSGETRGGVLFVKVGESGDCSSWGNACDLQSALSSAVAGDEIWVAEGTYYPTSGTDRTLSFQLKNGVVVYGGFAGTETARNQRDWVDNPTILSGDIGVTGNNTDNSFHVVYGTGLDNTAILDGFTITTGNANGTSAASYGGGMYNTSSSPTLTNITFSSNSAIGGGGVFNDLSSNPILTNVTFSGNSAYYGGGMHNNYSSPNLNNVNFSSNSATGNGGGMYNEESNPSITNAYFSSNSAVFWGGGMNNYHSSPTLTNVTFVANSADNGGGLFNGDLSELTLTNVIFSGNTANYGGGITNSSCVSSILTNVTFSGNSVEFYGGGMYDFSSYQTLLTNVTFTGNSADVGGGVFTDSSNLSITNTILWGNSLDQIFVNTGSQTLITYSILPFSYPGEGNINSNPFLGPLADNGGFTQTHALLPGSPAIDSGNPSVCPATDQRGVTRPIDGNKDGIPRCDIGAYEYLPSYNNYLPLILKAPTTIPDPIVNGDFEDGKTGWTEAATNTRDLIVNSGFPGGVTPHSGIWAAWLGGDHYEDTSTISQYVSIPVGRSMLHFWYWISALENCGPDDFTLSVQSTPLLTWDLCGATDTGGWVEHSIDLSAYAGTSAWIAFSVTLDDADTSQVFIDDVSLEVH